MTNAITINQLMINDFINDRVDISNIYFTIPIHVIDVVN